MKIFGMVGRSGSGKTTLLKLLLPELIGRGFRVSTMKHTHHSVDLDIPGKDSYEHRKAGAQEVLITSSTRWALMHELRQRPEPDMDELIARMTPVDLLLIEGFKRHRHDKMEINRGAPGKPLICNDDKTIVAISSDQPLAGLGIPLIDLNNPVAIADFIVVHCQLEKGQAHGPA
ncbi:MAG TPA: molybdopterin-guanine dinucleotide biosynthesis protein B [Rhodospirillales bacterium]|nr:molybdopterin-guanine dinucleotide biosynthesis protein B [Rhodospirillales bacterium]